MSPGAAASTGLCSAGMDQDMARPHSATILATVTCPSTWSRFRRSLPWLVFGGLVFSVGSGNCFLVTNHY